MRPRPAASLVLSLALVAACSGGGAREPSAGSSSSTTSTSRPSIVWTTAPTTTTTVALPPPVPVAWSSCGGGLDCATVTVPVSYQGSTGPTLDLALVRNPADLPDQRIGSLLMNPGGPGASGVRRVARGFQVSPEVGDRFDIIGFDPRGVGGSAAITCGEAVPSPRGTASRTSAQRRRPTTSR